jgi:GAF domain-containing protein
MGSFSGMSGGDQDLEMAGMFAEVARALLAEPDTQSTLERIVTLAVESIEACEYAGISEVEGKRVTSPASSDELPAIVDRLQSETGEGPCVDASIESDIYLTGNLSSETRWPEFSRRAAAESGVESVLALRLSGEGAVGALNLYSTRRDAFDEHDIAVASVFVAHASVAWSNAKTVDNLRAAMDSRQIIGQAMGLIMARQHISEDEAFDVLRRASQRMNVRLRVVAERIVDPDSTSE